MRWISSHRSPESFGRQIFFRTSGSKISAPPPGIEPSPASRSRRRTAEAEATRPPLAPFEELLGELDRLKDEPSLVLLHTRLSLALRHYLARSLDFPALESTTSEIQRRLNRRLSGPLVRQTVELLRGCDLVKFARQEVGHDRARERVAAARQVARELETHLRPVEPVELFPPERLEAAS